ncbi:MAG: FtsX-like permease family protein [Phycisphaeraceae bacterium]|nr:FtsX-like permease family protein [Phycisphaeraceae bacterium]MCB9847406.1 FtsX-like permease family protein [Phycisphaeraceae bacterium]
MSGRWRRTALLIAAVSLSAALVVGVSCAIASVNAGMALRAAYAVGAADARIRHVGERPFDESLLETVRGWDGVRIASGRSKGALPLAQPGSDEPMVTVGWGVEPGVDERTLPHKYILGRPVERDGEVVIEERLAEQLDVSVGGRLETMSFYTDEPLTVVGVFARPLFGNIARTEAFVTRPTLASITGDSGRLSTIELVLRQGVEPTSFCGRHMDDLPPGLVLRTTERAASSLAKNVHSSNIGMVFAAALTFLAASFIILTGLTTGVLERQRELAILRCVGARKAQIAASQLSVGIVIGGIGALIGTPLGLGIAYAASVVFRENLPAGLHISALGLALSIAGSVGAGLLGALWPALSAARVTPLAAMRIRATPRNTAGVIGSTAAGLALIVIAIVSSLATRDGQLEFWLINLVSTPALFAGYFLLGTPVTLLVMRLLGAVVNTALRLPRGMLSGTIRATPLRHGFTAGSLMVGLSLLVSLWTNGNAMLRDWLGAVRFPDAFVSGPAGLPPDAKDRIEALPFVERTTAITLQRLDQRVLGMRSLVDVKTSFIAFEPRLFFDMVSMEWVQGNQEEAIRRLEEGGAVVVAREFNVARGLGLGDTVTLEFNGREYAFDIVGVVSSPGLELVAQYYDIGQERAQQSISAVFGSRKDLIEKFGNDAISLLQVDLDDDVDPRHAVSEMKSALRGSLLAVGSGASVRDSIQGIGRTTMRVMSIVAVGALLIASFGVASVVIAGIDARRYEFGVLRAIGAQGGLLRRLVVGETVIIALSACVLGVGLGLHGAATGQIIYELIAGLRLRVVPPMVPIALGCAAVVLTALGAAWPSAARLSRKSPRELLTATRG